MMMFYEKRLPIDATCECHIICQGCSFLILIDVHESWENISVCANQTACQGIIWWSGSSYQTISNNLSS
jgi:hypothetical protein